MVNNRVLLWHVDQLVDWTSADGCSARFPKSCVAILAMRDAIKAELPYRALKKSAYNRRTGPASGGRRTLPTCGSSRTWRCRMLKKMHALTAELHTLKSSKSVRGRVSEEWLTRVILAAPNVSGRALADSFHVIVGSDRNTICRSKIGSIRSAFLEMWKSMVLASARDCIAAQRRVPSIGGTRKPAIGGRAAFVSVFMTHVQDEADIRLLSSDPSSRPGLPSRSRTSKVQMHVVTVSCNGKSWVIPTELEALANKTAATLATSFERLLLALLAELVGEPTIGGITPAIGGGLAAVGRARKEVFFVHIIIGDGIATNEAAAKILNALRVQGAFAGVRYMLLLGKCGTHQSALSAKHGVVGRAAAGAAASAGEGKEFEDVVATATRLFKYLVPDYYEDIKSSAEAWVRDHVDIVPFQPHAASSASDGQPSAANLQLLYTKRVIPDALLQLWQSSLGGRVQTMLREGENMTAGRHRIHQEWMEYLTKYLMRVDAHPTLTRFFSFRCCVDNMLAMSLLDFPCAGGFSVKNSARDESQKRLRRVLSFFSKSPAWQALRRANLVLQLTAAVEKLMSASPASGGIPVIVAIHKGDVHAELKTTLQRLIEVMHIDPFLNHAAAVFALLGTAGDLVVRLDHYMRYPYKFVQMVAKWFPTSHHRAITAFLRADAAELDAGFSLVLQELALAEDGEMAQRAFLLQRDVQTLLENAGSAFLANSLSAERAAAEVKRREGRNISLIGNVSRDLLCRRFSHLRTAQALAIDSAQSRVDKLRRTNWTAFAWQIDGCPTEGVRFESQPLAAEVPAVCGKAAMPHTCGVPAPAICRKYAHPVAAPSKDGNRKHRKRARSSSATAAAPTARARDAAPKEKCKAMRDASVAAAQSKLDLLKSQACTLPCTRVQWAVWLGENVDELRMRMRPGEAPLRRRAFNSRVSARAGLPLGQRIQPAVGAHRATTPWGKLLELRHGWYGVVSDRGRFMFFVLYLSSATYVIDMESYRQPSAAAFPYRITSDFDITDDLMPLPLFEDKLKDCVVSDVYEFTVVCEAIATSGVGIAAPAIGGITAESACGCILLKPMQGTVITAAVNRGAENKTAEDAADGHEANAANSDIDDPAAVVDTDHASIAESGDTTGSAASTDSETEVAATPSRALPKPMPAIGGTPQPMPVIGGKPTVRKPAIGGGLRVFDNGYFHARQQFHHNTQQIRMYINEIWLGDPPAGIGRKPTMSKTLSMVQNGDTEDDPLRSTILARAWMVWRVRQHPEWLTSDCHRQRLFTEEADLLVADVKRMQPQKD